MNHRGHILAFAMLLSGIASAQDGGKWEALRDYEASKHSPLVWWRVVQVADRDGTREIVAKYASYSPKESAENVAAEMNRMKLGRAWNVGLKAQEVIDIQNHLSRVSAEVKAPSIEEQRAWWKARERQ